MSQTPADIIDQIGALLTELKAALTPPQPPDQPPSYVTVTDAVGLTAALTVGGEIRMQPGTYSGNFVVSQAGTILRGSEPTGRRVSPEDVAAYRLAPADPLFPPLTITASNVTVQGLYITNGAIDRDTVVIGSQDATDVTTQPDRVTLDSVAIVAGENGGHRGIAAHGSHITVIRSHIANWWEDKRDSQAFWANNGPGPYLIEDCYLEASGENILFGGANIAIDGLVPEDITIRNNDIVKPLAWKGSNPGDVKNSIEFKNGRHALIEGNRIDGNWKDGQAGHTIVLTPRNQSGKNPWVQVDDITIRGNVLRNLLEPTSYAINILGHDNMAPSQQMRRVVIEGNYFPDATNLVMVQRGVSEALIIRRNTAPAIVGKVIYFAGNNPDGTPMVVTPTTLEANVFRQGYYGIFASGAPGTGVKTLDIWGIPYSVAGNVIERHATQPGRWPAGNTLLDPGALAGLLDADGHYTGPEPAGY